MFHSFFFYSLSILFEYCLKFSNFRIEETIRANFCVYSEVKKLYETEFKYMILYPCLFESEIENNLKESEFVIFFPSNEFKLVDLIKKLKLDKNTKTKKFFIYVPELKAKYFNFTSRNSENIVHYIEKLIETIYEKYKKKPHLIGFSLGCAISLEVLVRSKSIQKKIKSIIFWCPSYSFHDFIINSSLSKNQKYIAKLLVSRMNIFNNAENLKKLIIKSRKDKKESVNDSIEELYFSKNPECKNSYTKEQNDNLSHQEKIMIYIIDCVNKEDEKNSDGNRLYNLASSKIYYYNSYNGENTVGPLETSQCIKEWDCISSFFRF